MYQKEVGQIEDAFKKVGSEVNEKHLIIPAKDSSDHPTKVRFLIPIKVVE